MSFEQITESRASRSSWMPPSSSGVRCEEPQTRSNLSTEAALIALADKNDKVREGLKDKEKRERILTAINMSLSALRTSPQKEMDKIQQNIVWAILRDVFGVKTPDVIGVESNKKQKSDEKLNELFEEIENQRRADDAEMDSTHDRLDVPFSDTFQSSPALP